MKLKMFDVPYKELMLHVVPLPPTLASVRTAASFIEIVEVKPRPSSEATLTGLVVPPIFRGPLDGIVMAYSLVSSAIFASSATTRSASLIAATRAAFP